jgi:hypothetical protein
MASDIRFSTTALNAMLDSLNATLGTAALLRWYSGTKPATADAALSGNTLLAEQALTTPNEFGAAASRVITAAAIGDDISANATGTCTFASFVTSGGVRVIDVTVGEAADSADITVDNKNFQAGANISVTSFTLGLNL